MSRTPFNDELLPAFWKVSVCAMVIGIIACCGPKLALFCGLLAVFSSLASYLIAFHSPKSKTSLIFVALSLISLGSFYWIGRNDTLCSSDALVVARSDGLANESAQHTEESTVFDVRPHESSRQNSKPPSLGATPKTEIPLAFSEVNYYKFVDDSFYEHIYAFKSAKSLKSYWASGTTDSSNLPNGDLSLTVRAGMGIVLIPVKTKVNVTAEFQFGHGMVGYQIKLLTSGPAYQEGDILYVIKFGLYDDI